MITPTDADTGHAGIARHLDVKSGVTDHDGASRIGTGFSHRPLDHGGMRLAGCQVGSLQSHETAAEAVHAKGRIKPAPGLAGGDAEHAAGSLQPVKRIGDAGEQRLLVLGALAHGAEDRLVTFRNGAVLVAGKAGTQRCNGLDQGQTDHRAYLGRGWRTVTAITKRLAHRRDDIVLAVDQRAVAVEDDEPDRTCGLCDQDEPLPDRAPTGDCTLFSTVRITSLPRMGKSDLTQLGRPAPIPASPAEAVIETVANPHPGTVYLVRFTAPEFTCLCPITGQPDFAHLVIDYVPDKRLVESKSLKLFLASFRNHGAFHEDSTLLIAKRLGEVLAPIWLRIGGYWYPRGGMPIDVFYQTGTPPAGLWLPDQGMAPYRGRG